jgi:hypothetical protein
VLLMIVDCEVGCEKKEENNLDKYVKDRAGCGSSRQRLHTNTKPRIPTLGPSSLLLREHSVFAESFPSERRPFFIPGRQTGGKSLVTLRKVTDMNTRWKCADGAAGASPWRRIQKPQRKAYRIELTQTDCALLDKIRKPGQTHVEAFRELLRRVG